MFSSAVKVQNYRRLLQMHKTTPSSLRNDALGLDLRVQRKLFETSPIQTLKKKRNFGEMMTTHRYEDVMEPSYTPRTTRSDREVKYLPSCEKFALLSELRRNSALPIWFLVHLMKVKKKRYKNLER